MRFCSESGKILISLKEFVEIARRGIASHSYDEFEEAGFHDFTLKNQKDCTVLSYDFKLGQYSFTLIADAIKTEGDKVYTSFTVESNPKAPTRAEVSYARAMAFVLGKMYSELVNSDKITLSIIYISKRLGESYEANEIVPKEKLTAFFDKCAASLLLYAKPEVERVTLRLPSFSGLKFPYKALREGQGDFVRTVYRNIARGGTLFASAPTGTGKTVSVLYPALRALGEKKTDKIFYLTPKGTTSEAARDCLMTMSSKGAKIKSIIISSKEKSCKNGLLCRENRALCSNAKCKLLADAVLELYNSEKPVIDITDIQKAAAKYSVCPYELELTYSELCDIVICDFNYLFDPVVYIKRYFSTGGRFTFLIDEAHNLPDRAREIYSAALDLSDIRLFLQNELLSPLSKLVSKLPEYCERWQELLFPYLKEEIRADKDKGKVGATHLSEIPSLLYSIIDEMIALSENELLQSYIARDIDAPKRTSLIKAFLYQLKKFSFALNEFDDAYKLFLFYENGNITAKLFCIDPGRLINKRLEAGHGAVFFSATLSPINYYKSVLGGDGASSTIEINSPFDPSQLCVSIMDKISTRYSERYKTLPAVCRAISATLSAKRGNYIVFSPSFEYSQALAEAFKAKYPKIKVLSQTKDMTKKQKSDFLSKFSEKDSSYLIGFCVMGGIYSEGVDLVGDSLIGAVVVGVGMPSICYEREAIAEYYNDKYDEGKQFAYIYPGMNRVLQAAGRVIRSEKDKGVIVLIDDRFDDPIYKKSIPSLWHGMEYVSDAKSLNARISDFWKFTNEELANK